MTERKYYAQRRGLADPEPIDIDLLKKGFMFIFKRLEAEYFFQGATGYYCVDHGFQRRKWGEDIEYFIYSNIHMRNVWPLEENIDDFDMVKLFTVIEFLYDNVSEPIDLWHHPWDQCGYHSSEYNWENGKVRYRNEMNEILRLFENGYELSVSGEILELTPTGLETLEEEIIETGDSHNIDDRIQSAIIKYRRFNATLDDKKDAMRTLGDVLEYLKSQNIRLPSRDDSDLFNILNNFDIRHHRTSQQGGYDREVWYDWFFYTFLASINLLLQLHYSE